MGGNVAENEGGRIFDFPTPVVGSYLDRGDGLEVVPRLSVGSISGQVDLKSLVDDGNAGLNLPEFLLTVGLHQFF